MKISILYQVASETASYHSASGHRAWIGASSQDMQLEGGDGGSVHNSCGMQLWAQKMTPGHASLDM